MNKICREQFLAGLSAHFGDDIKDAYLNLKTVISQTNGEKVSVSEQLRFESHPDSGELDMDKLKFR